MQSLPRADMTEKSALHPIKGQPPSLIDLPSGCSFHPRCPYTQQICKEQVPKKRTLGGIHVAECHFAGDPGFVRRDPVEGEVR
jgi:oligopeptide/dipeptide ABC transporter ATP-binding protein